MRIVFLYKIEREMSQWSVYPHREVFLIVKLKIVFLIFF